MLSCFACCTARETPKGCTDTQKVEPLMFEAMNSYLTVPTEERTAVGNQLMTPVAAEVKPADAAVAFQHGNRNAAAFTVLNKHQASVPPEEMPWAIALIPWFLTLGVLLLSVALLRSLRDPPGVDGCKWLDSTLIVVGVFVFLRAHRQPKWLQDRLKITSGWRLPFLGATTHAGSKSAAAAVAASATAAAPVAAAAATNSHLHWKC
mmetsp:Transcript_74644/g.144485  ORF Transcript_74644/g.144485 Transcript_74644/m.144485 type:complete len:206 (-) Transcript_74644:20-637(-)